MNTTWPLDSTGPFETPPDGYDAIAGVEPVPTLVTDGTPWRAGFGEAYWTVQTDSLLGGTVDAQPFWYNPIAGVWCSAGPVATLTIPAAAAAGAGVVFRMMAPAGDSRIAIQIVAIAVAGTLTRSLVATRKAS